MARKTDLEQHLRASYKLIKEYEEILRLSGDPTERARAAFVPSMSNGASSLSTWQSIRHYVRPRIRTYLQILDNSSFPPACVLHPRLK